MAQAADLSQRAPVSGKLSPAELRQCRPCLATQPSAAQVPCKNPPRSPQHSTLRTGWLFRGRGRFWLRWERWGGKRCWRGREESFPHFYLSEILLVLLYSFGRGRSSAFVFFYCRGIFFLLHSFGRGRSSAFVFIG